MENKFRIQTITKIKQIQCVPRKGFGSAVCIQRERYILCSVYQGYYNSFLISMVYIVSQPADRNPFLGTHCILSGKDRIEQAVTLKSLQRRIKFIVVLLRYRELF